MKLREWEGKWLRGNLSLRGGNLEKTEANTSSHKDSPTYNQNDGQPNNIKHGNGQALLRHNIDDEEKER